MANADDSFKEAVSHWMDDNAWPQPPPTVAAIEEAKSILILTGITEDGRVFEFKSARGYFEVSGVYHPSTDLLTSLRVALMVPGYPKDVLLVGTDVYRLSTDEGRELPFNIQDVIRGTLSFKYIPRGRQQDIAMRYSAQLPFSGNLEDTISISPTDLILSPLAEKMKAIPAFTPSRLQLETEKVTAFQASTMGETQFSTLSRMDNAEQQLLVKFLSDFADDGDKIVIETFYPPTGDDSRRVFSTLRATNGSQEYAVSVSFLSIFELVGSVDPATLMASVGLFVRIPIAGRVRITNIQGSLGSTAGITASVNAVVARGSATLTAERNQNGRLVLFVDLTLRVKFVGNITSNGKHRLVTLPF